jgi:CDP-diacylglycerol pyrophosphatase
VRSGLRKYEARIGEDWSKHPFHFSGYPFKVMRVHGETLDATNPFALVSKGIDGARSDMASQTIVVAGAKFLDGGDGFYILADHSRPNRPATGERVLDYSCSG